LSTKQAALNEITFVQFVSLLFGLQVGIGLLALPQELAERAGTDGWISLLLGWTVSTGASLLIVTAMKALPKGSFPEQLSLLFGKWAYKVVCVMFALWAFYYSYTCLVRTILYTKVWLLQQTPMYITMLLLIVPSYTIARGGLRVVGRYAELIVTVSFWVPLVYLLPLKDAHWLYLFPVLKDGWKPIFTAFEITPLSYSGISAVFLLYPFLKDKSKAAAGVIVSNSLSLFTFVLTTVVCFVYFSPDEITQFNEPVLNVLKTIQFNFVERIEVLFLAYFLIIFSLAWIPTAHLAVYCTTRLFGGQDHRAHLRIWCLLLACVTFFYIPGFHQNDRMERVLVWMELGIGYALPILLLLYAALFRHRIRRGSA